MTQRQWIVQYTYPGTDGKVRMSIDQISAHTKTEAMEKAAERAPHEEFMVSVHPKTDEQELDFVRHEALSMTQKSDDVSIYEDDGDEEGL